MTTQTKGILVVAGVVLLAGGAYLITKKKDGIKIQDKIHEILSLGGITSVDATTLNKMNTFDVAYIDAWLQGLRDKANVFVYNGKQYLTTGGKAVK